MYSDYHIHDIFYIKRSAVLRVRNLKSSYWIGWQKCYNFRRNSWAATKVEELFKFVLVHKWMEWTYAYLDFKNKLNIIFHVHCTLRGIIICMTHIWIFINNTCNDICSCFINFYRNTNLNNVCYFVYIYIYIYIYIFQFILT